MAPHENELYLVLEDSRQNHQNAFVIAIGVLPKLAPLRKIS
jgi:hypothetical protein